MHTAPLFPEKLWCLNGASAQMRTSYFAISTTAGRTTALMFCVRARSCVFGIESKTMPRCGNRNVYELLSQPARGITAGVTKGNDVFSGTGAPTLARNCRNRDWKTPIPNLSA
jgi:hypothetical protein